MAAIPLSGRCAASDRKARDKFASNKCLYRRFIAPGDLVFDIGANRGHMTEAFAALGASVIAFEPQDSCADDIEGMGNPNITVVRKCLSNEFGKSVLYFSDCDAHATLTTPLHSLSFEYHNDPKGIASMKRCVSVLEMLSPYSYAITRGEGIELSDCLSPHQLINIGHTLAGFDDIFAIRN